MNRFIELKGRFVAIAFLCFFFVPVALLIFPAEASAQVVVNEFSSYSSSDWVELYAFEETDISGWILKDDGTSTNMAAVPEGVTIGPTSGAFYVIQVSNRLNIDGDIITLYDKNNTQKDQLAYGDKGGVCAPGESQSAGRYPDANSTKERFSSPSQGSSNNSATLAACPTPIPESTPTPTVTPTPTSTPTLTATPKPSPTKAPTSKPTPTSAALAQKTNSPENDSILGLREGLSTSPPPDSQVVTKNRPFPVLALVLVVVGIFLIGFVGITFLKNRKSGYTGRRGQIIQNT